MTQTTPTPTPPHVPAAGDALVASYHAAQAALDADASTAVQASPAVRANVMAYAQQLADARRADAPVTAGSAPASTSTDAINSIAHQAVNTWTTGSFENKKSAINDSQWTIKALASVAVFGLSSLLFIQWHNATTDEQDAAFSVQRPAPIVAPAGAPSPALAPASAANADVTSSQRRTDTPVAAPETRALDKASAKAKATPAPAPAPAPAPVPAPAPAPTIDSVAKSNSTKPMREPAAELAAGNAPMMESAPPAPTSAAAPTQSPAAMSTPAPAAAPVAAPAPAATPAPAQARARAAPRDATLEQSQDNLSAPRGKPSASSAAKEANSVAINPAGSGSSDSFAAGPSGAVAAKPLPQSSPLAAAASVNSALFNAIRSKNRNALQAALDNGADKNAKDNGTPAITLCVQAGQTELVRLLAAAGADVNALDAQGISVLEHARGRGVQDIMALLVQYGAK